jgi:hypothetical protein
MKFLINYTAKIDWNLFFFHNLAILIGHKKIFLALAKIYLSHGLNNKFNDFVERKGQDLIALLQYYVRSLALSRELTFS